MSLKKAQVFVCLYKLDDNWFFGCPDVNANTFGFVPSNYLQFIQEIDKMNPKWNIINVKNILNKLRKKLKKKNWKIIIILP